MWGHFAKIRTISLLINWVIRCAIAEDAKYEACVMLETKDWNSGYVFDL